MASQAFLNGLRAQAGMGTGQFTRPAPQRSADQNQAQSGNPGLANNMAPTKPMPWQQGILQQQQNAQMLASDPTNIRYTIPQQQQNAQAYQGSQAQLQAQNGAQQIPNSGGFGSWANQDPSMYASMFTQPMPNPQGGITGQMGQMPQNGFTQPIGGGPVPRNLAAGPSGYRMVRPMAR